MELNGFLEVFGGGMLGVILVELLKVASFKTTGKLAEKYGEPMYWIATGALLVVSGCVAALNGTEHVSVIKAIQLGINAPAIVAGYASGSTAARQHNQNQAGFIAGAVKPTRSQRVTELLSW